MNNDIIMVVAVVVVVVVDAIKVVITTLHKVEVVITILHKITRSIRSIMQKNMIKEKVFVNVLSRILEIPIINVVPKGTGVESVEHKSIFVSFTRYS